MLPAIEGSPVKPFFLGHIALELIIDNLLLTTGKIQVDDFYANLAACETAVINNFLTFSGLTDSNVFLKFFDDFKRSQYLHTYAETHQIAYALKRICMRIWRNPFTPQHEALMNEVLSDYRDYLLPDFMLIFEEIANKLIAI